MRRERWWFVCFDKDFFPLLPVKSVHDEREGVCSDGKIQNFVGTFLGTDGV
jgi:hypothetical protein